MRIWFKMFKDTKILKDETIENYEEDTRTHKILQAVEDVCYHMDLGKPIWLDSNVKEFQRHSKTRFTKDNFVEEIEFDFLEMEVLEED
ncbi:MAG: hypothetical protein UIC64_09775 [Agathobacter sp.]|nr:hypothetical protein [Agathobacter sp.]